LLHKDTQILVRVELISRGKMNDLTHLALQLRIVE
jgi:hypothetical protein